MNSQKQSLVLQPCRQPRAAGANSLQATVPGETEFELPIGGRRSDDDSSTPPQRVAPAVDRLATAL